MRIACIYCEVLFRELCLAASASDAVVDFIALPQGLHNTPAELRQRVQKEIDRLEDGPEHIHAKNDKAATVRKYDAILLAYALCSNGVAGLTSQHTPLVIPRGHDCIALLLGSKEVYQEYFDNHRGVYWYSSGWIERTLQPGRERMEITLRLYQEAYGDDNAEYLMEMEQNWYKEYNWATYINWNLPTSERDRRYTKECAEFLGWNYDELDGDPSLLNDFLQGNWDSDRFLIVPPGSCIEPSNDPSIMKSCAGCSCHGLEQMGASPLITNDLCR